MIERFYTSDGVVQRLADNGQYAGHIASLPCHVQPLEDAPSEDLRGTFGKDFTLYCGVADIGEHDRVVIAGTSYLVVGGETFAFGCGTGHMELRIRKSY